MDTLKIWTEFIQKQPQTLHSNRLTECESSKKKTADFENREPVHWRIAAISLYGIYKRKTKTV